MSETQERTQALREQMKRLGWDAYVVWGTDPHESEYVAARWQTRRWLSGFSGSAGTLALTQDAAALWTDGRYFLQAEAELQGSTFELMREGRPETPSVWEWLAQRLHAGNVVGVAAETTNLARYRQASEVLQTQEITLEAGEDPLDRLWLDRPEAPASDVWDYQTHVKIEPRGEKLQRLRQILKIRHLDAFLVTALDEIAWLFNLRGADIPYNPVFLAYAVVSTDKATLFTNPERLESSAQKALEKDGVEVRPYAEVQHFLAALPLQKALGLSPEKTNLALMAALKKAGELPLSELNSPLAGLKAVKTDDELELVRQAHFKDGLALVEFLAWFSRAVNEESLTELDCAQKLDEFRARHPHWKGPSFEPIPGFREHGAIVHYKVENGRGSRLSGNGLFLLDTGAQYLEGTTDVTRTLIVGSPETAQIEDYTWVLKAHVQLALTPFPRGTRGYTIDAIARRCLWQSYRQFQHGTGHGVGHFLSVHEGPQRLNSEPLPTVLEPGMVLSNEPGVYRKKRWGIRIENLVAVRPSLSNEFADFLEWETLTLCPYERRLIDSALLDPAERRWIDDYHRRVFTILSPGLTSEARRWLEVATRPLSF
jgi:Xaa-Pro aminopeptidase